MEEQERLHPIAPKSCRRVVKKLPLLDGASYKQAAQRSTQSKQRYVRSKIIHSITQAQALVSQAMEISNLMQASWKGIHFKLGPSHVSNLSKTLSHLPVKY